MERREGRERFQVRDDRFAQMGRPGVALAAVDDAVPYGGDGVQINLLTKHLQARFEGALGVRDRSGVNLAL